MSLEDELDDVVERYETASLYEKYPLETSISYKYEDEVDDEQYETGYCIKVETMVNGEKWGTEVVVPEEIDVERVEQVIENVLTRIRQELWREYVNEVTE